MSNLRQMLAQDFDMDLPISGGFGQSVEEPIILEKVVPNDYVSVEYAVLKCLGIGRGIEWRLLKQTLLEHNGRMIDQMKIETRQLTDSEAITQVENYYFDVSQCINDE